MQLDRKVLAFGQLPSSKGDLYVPASGRKAFVHNIVIHNTNTTAEDVVLNYHDGSTEKQWLSQTIAAGDTLTLDFPGEGDVVGVGGKYTGNTDTASKVTFKFSGTEEVPDTIQDDVLWEWNGNDITQFGNGSGTPDHTYGSPDGTLSVGAVPTASTDVPSGDVLLYTTGTATSAHAHFYINDLPSLPERFIYRARLGPRVGGGTTQPMLIAAGQDELHWYGTAYSGGGVLQVQLGNNRDAVFVAGHYIATSIGDENFGTIVELDCMLVDPSTGVDPQINVGLREFRGGLWTAGLGGPAWSSFGSPPSIYDASWQSGGTIKNPGVAFLCNGTAAVSWVGELQILRHPWQKVA